MKEQPLKLSGKMREIPMYSSPLPTMTTFHGTVIAARIRYGSETPTASQHFFCHDCGAERGHFHMLGCDMEQCANCNGQLFCCDCKAHYDAVERDICAGFYAFDTEPFDAEKINERAWAEREAARKEQRS